MSTTETYEYAWKLVNGQIAMFYRESTKEGWQELTDASVLSAANIYLTYASAVKVTAVTDTPEVREDFHRTAIVHYCLCKYYERKGDYEQSEYYYNKYKRALRENFDDEVPVRVVKPNPNYSLL